MIDMNKLKTILFYSVIVFVFSSCKQIRKSYEETISPNPIRKTEKEIETRSDSLSMNRRIGKSNEAEISLFESVDRLNLIQEELLNLPQFKGKKLMAYQSLYFYDFNNGHISLKIQDPNIPENIDEYVYRDGNWQQPIPVKITGNIPVEHYLFPLEKVKFSVAKIVHDQIVNEANMMDGGKASDHVYFNYINMSSGKQYYWYSSVSGNRKDLYIDFDMEGKEIKRR